jgi:NDP-sugar pyrophosphorylase family protein
MKTMILAAGLGARLRPLTEAIPKPMIPVVNKPVMELVIELLSRQGFRVIFANVHYRADEIVSYFGSGWRWGVDLKYSHEEVLAGTAGGLKRLADDFRDNTFIVFSSDLLTDIDLAPIIEFHKQKKALATIALTRVADPSSYGTVMLDPNGRVTGFQEKPDRGEALSNLISCGVYVFEPDVLAYIPAVGPYDFGSDLFPALQAAGAPLYGYEHHDYWLDIGKIENYLKGNFDALTGNVHVKMPGQSVADGIWVGDATEIHHSARMTGPLCIGNDCVIRRNACLIGPAIIGNNNVINEGTLLQQAIKLPNGHVEKNMTIVGGIIGDSEQTVSLLVGRS